MQTQHNLPSRYGRIIRGQSGQAMVFMTVGVAGMVIFALVALAVDFGSVLQVRRELQASTDAAALAGAAVLDEGDAQAIAVANQFSGKNGSKNAKLAHPATMMAGYPLTKCLTSTGVPCYPTSNAIIVKQQAPAPLVLGRIVGLQPINVQAIAAASAKGSGPPQLDLMMVMDITGSMNSSCSSSISGISSPRKLDCAKAGVRALLTSLWPCHSSKANCGTAVNGQVADNYDSVGMVAFPGLKLASEIPRHFDCSDNLLCTSATSSSCDYQRYSVLPNYYNVVPLSSDYKTSAFGSLNGSSSNLIKAIDWSNGAGCSSSRYGLEAAPNGIGMGTYFAEAIKQAQATLVSTGRSTIQDVMIVLSDGDANTLSGMGSNQCQRAVTEADAAASAGTWVYSIAYQASTSRTGSCDSDGGRISGKETMEAIASDSSKFYNQPSPGDLTAIFKKIAADLTTVRMIPESTL